MENGVDAFGGYLEEYALLIVSPAKRCSIEIPVTCESNARIRTIAVRKMKGKEFTERSCRGNREDCAVRGAGGTGGHAIEVSVSSLCGYSLGRLGRVGRGEGVNIIDRLAKAGPAER